MHAQCLADDRIEDGQLPELIVSHVAPGAVGVAEELSLLLVQRFADLGVVRDVKQHPGAGCRAGVLTGHEKRNEDVRYLALGQRRAILVRLAHEGSHHVMIVLCGCIMSRKNEQR